MACSSVESLGRPSPSMAWLQSPPRTAASTSGLPLTSLTLSIAHKYAVGHKKISNIRQTQKPAPLGLRATKHQRVAPTRLVDQVRRYREVDEDLAQPAHVVAHLFREEGGVRPGLAQDLRCREVPVGMVEQELQELELPLGQGNLAALVADDAARGVDPESLQLPDPPVPEIQTHLVSLHLGLDDVEVGGGRLLGRHREVGYVFSDPVQDSPLELEQVGVNADPVARVLPALGLEVLALEHPRSSPPNHRHGRTHGSCRFRFTPRQLLRRSFQKPQPYGCPEARGALNFQSAA